MFKAFKSKKLLQLQTYSLNELIYISVSVPVTKIDGAPDIFAKSGSSVDITCTVTDARASSLIWWKYNWSLSVLIPFCIRYKDGEVIPVEEWEDVSVQMTKEDGSVISVLTINNLSHQRYDGYDIVEIRCFSYI